MRVWSGRVEVVAHFGLFVAVGMQQCFRGLCILKWQHVNTRAQWFFCTGTKWSMLHTSPLSGFSIVTDKCTVLKIKFCYILQLTEMNPTLFVMFKIAKSIMGTMLGKSQNKFIPKGEENQGRVFMKRHIPCWYYWYTLCYDLTLLYYPFD